MNFDEYWKRFNALEKKHNLLEWKIDGQPLYALRRIKFYYGVAVALGLFNNPHPGAGATKVKPEPISLSFKDVPPTPVLVVPFRRLVAGVDPYSQSVFDRLEAQGRAPQVLDWEWVARIQASALPEYRKLVKGKWSPSSFKAKLSDKFEDKNLDEKWAKIIAHFEEEFGVELSKQALPKGSFTRLKVEIEVIADYFKKAKLRELYIVDAYSNQWLVSAAHKVGAKVFEIQHGFVSEYHPAYSFPLGSPKQAHTPDQLLLWGKFWLEGISFPAGMTPIVYGPSKQFAEYREDSAKVKRVEKQILFTSQGAISEELLKAALTAAKALPGYEIIYRLHPNEQLENYPQTRLPKNFSYSHKSPVFLELLSRCEYLVGAFSTTLYEGMALGAKVLVLPLPGYENMQRAIASGDATLVTNIDRIGDFIRQATQATNPDNYYAKEIVL